MDKRLVQGVYGTDTAPGVVGIGGGGSGSMHERALRASVIAIVVAVPPLMLLVPIGATELFVLAALAGIVAMMRAHGDVHRAFGADERIAALGCIVFTATVLFSVAEQGFAYPAVRELDVLLRPLLAIGVLFLLTRTRPPEGVLWFAMAIGAVLGGIYAIYEVLIIEAQSRAQAAAHPIVYGRTTLGMGFIAAIGLPYFRQLGRGYALIPCAALLLGLVGSFLSGSRGAWIALPVLLPLLLWQHWRPGYHHFAVIGAIALLALSVVLFAIPETGVQKRYQTAVEQVQRYLEDPAEHGGTSVGMRFEMWRGVLHAFVQHPVSGVGMGERFNAFLTRGVEAGTYHPAMKRVSMPHNAYLQVLVARGLIGFAGLLALWLALGYVFWNATRHESGSTLRTLGVAGLCLLALYLVGGLTHSVMDYGPPLMFFCMYSMVLVHLIGRARLGRNNESIYTGMPGNAQGA